jgi:hypothetical protein
MAGFLLFRILWTTPAIVHPFVQKGNSHDK